MIEKFKHIQKRLNVNNSKHMLLKSILLLEKFYGSIFKVFKFYNVLKITSSIFTISILIFLLLLFISEYKISGVKKYQYFIYDILCELNANLTYNNEAERIAIIDIDEQTFRSKLWGGGFPAVLPLPDLTKLILIALEKGAEIIILDFDLQRLEHHGLSTFSEDMSQILAKYNDRHLILTTSFWAPIEPNAIQNKRKISLDSLIHRHPSNAHYATSTFIKDESGKTRYWRLWEVGCTQSDDDNYGTWTALPSVPLQVASINNKKNLPILSDYDLSGLCPVNFSDNSENKFSAELSKVDKIYSSWINYNFNTYYTQKISNNSFNVTQYFHEQNFENFINMSHSRIDTIPAISLLNPEKKEYYSQFFNGKDIIIVGASYEIAFDTHSTPLGYLPGTHILANSIIQISNGIPKRTNFILRGIIIFIFLLLGSYIIAISNSNFIKPTIFIISISIILSIVLSKLNMNDIFLDIGVAIVALIFSSQISNIGRKQNDFEETI